MVISSASIKAIITSIGTKATDLSTPSETISLSETDTFTDGAGGNGAEQHWSDQVTLTDGSNTELDLAGGLTDAFGDVITFTKIKAIFIRHNSTDSGLIYGHSAANGLPIMNAAALANAGGGVIAAGGWVLLVNPGSAGWAVTAGTGDLLKLEDDGTGAAGNKQVDVFILGETS